MALFTFLSRSTFGALESTTTTTVVFVLVMQGNVISHIMRDLEQLFCIVVVACLIHSWAQFKLKTQQAHWVFTCRAHKTDRGERIEILGLRKSNTLVVSSGLIEAINKFFNKIETLVMRERRKNKAALCCCCLARFFHGFEASSELESPQQFSTNLQLSLSQLVFVCLSI